MITKLSHIGIVVRNIEEATKYWTETFGFKVSHSGNAGVEGIKSVFLEVGDNFIEFLEPVDHHDMSNAVARRLASKGEGVYHIALVVDDLDNAGKELENKGVISIKRPATEDQPHGRLIIHPKSANGVMLELLI